MAGAETFSNGFLIVQAGVLLLTFLALFGAMMFAKRAVKAASFMREAQSEAQALYGSMDRQMQNLRMMGDEIHRMSDELALRQEEFSARLSSAPESRADVTSAAVEAEQSETVEEAPAAQALSVDEEAEEEKKPSALFRSLLRRR